jgi:hypothetical protein
MKLNIIQGIYNRYGENLSRQAEHQRREAYWALADNTSETNASFGLDENNIFQNGGW